jgi:nucleoside-diphosphate-sugar epimerase
MLRRRLQSLCVASDPRLVPELNTLVANTESVWEELRSARIFITGGTGFFGGWLVGSALHAIDALGLDTKICVLTRRHDLSQTAIGHLMGHPALATVQGDVCSFEFPHGEWSHILHAGAEASATLHREDPLGTFATNLEGTRRCLEMARRVAAKRFLYVSSGAVYGPMGAKESPVTEDYSGAPSPLSPATAYSQGKRAGEFLTIAMAQKHGFEACVGRCFAFVGPYQPLRSSFAISNFIADALEGKKIRVAGDGLAKRSYLYASDLAEHLWTLLVFGDAGEAFNVGSEEPISIGELAETVNDVLLGKGVEVMGVPDPNVPIQWYVPNCAKGRMRLGLQSRTGLRDAVLRSARWYSASLE